MRRAPYAVAALLLALGASGATADRAPKTLPPWTRGQLDIHQLSTGRGNAAFIVLPDGTTLLVDAGDAGEGIPLATAMPDASRGAGEWVARYVKRAAGEDAVIDYAVATHFHGDHIGNPQPARKKSAEGGYSIVGLAEVSEQVPIRKLIDRGYPEYGEPATPAGEIIENYRRFAAYAAKTRGMQRERIRVGRRDQIRLVHEATAFPQVEVRAVAGNGDVWTGGGSRFGEPVQHRASDPLRRVLLVHRRRPLRRAGARSAGMVEPRDADREGDRPDRRHGRQSPRLDRAGESVLSRGTPAASDRRTGVVADASVARRAEAASLDAHLERAARRLRHATPRRDEGDDRAARDEGRVEPGGASYRVYVIDDEDESGRVKSVHGPYASGAR
jgi:glyoxylase-like metal-dependent hydrolase (beta-lactamase superfamily II)